ncbi:MAG TPA: SRPBCC family protein [Acidimicrobiales bacterium]|nr:SRPBCC family protein [Acidimicrobiales bacterium]
MRIQDLAGLSTPEARLVVLPVGLGLLGLVGPERLSRTPSLCLVRRVFDSCPACGVTRAMAALVRGDLRPRRRRGLGALVLLTFGCVLLSDVRRVLSGGAKGASVSVSIMIDAPPSEVWDDLRDIASHTAWMQDAVAIRFTSDQQEGVGTTFEADTKVGPFRLSDPMEVTEWQEARCMAIRHGGVVTGTGRFGLEPAAGGRTRFTWDEELSFPWWMGGPAGALAAGQVLRLVWTRNLANLKRRVESR